MSTVKLTTGVYYSTKAAAAELGLTEGRIRQLVRASELAAIQVSPRAWLIKSAEIARAKKLREKPK